MQNMNTAGEDSRTKTQKQTPASLLKQLRATAAVICYDHCYGLPSMPITEFQRKLQNMYHGNEDLNLVSQVDLMLEGKGKYANMYQVVQTIVTATTPETSSNEIALPPTKLVLCPALLAFDTHIRYISKEHFTSKMLKCPTKTLSIETCSGRFLLDLSKQTVANIKKAAIIADEWLVDNGKPSGTIWEDLYSHLIENANRINAREKVFTGMAAFICFSKYNEGGENHLNFLAKNDDEAVASTDASRAKSRVSVKDGKDEERSIATNNNKLFNGRGYSLDSRMQMVEIAQFEDAQVRDDINSTLTHLTNRNKLLLCEREQEINLAKMICPAYDEDDDHWKRVKELSSDIANLKNEIIALEQKKNATNVKQSGSSMAAQFLASMRNQNEKASDTPLSSPNKRRFDSISVNDSATSTILSSPQGEITINGDASSTSSSLGVISDINKPDGSSVS